MRPARPFGLVLVFAVVSGPVLTSCAEPAELRREVIRMDTEWQLSTMEEGSFQTMLESLRSLGAQPGDTEGRLAAIPELLRVVLKNPSALVRAEALRAAWKLGAELPAEPWRVDSVDRAAFNERTERLDKLVESGHVVDTETLELAQWLGAVRIPPESTNHLSLAIGVCEVVLSQSLWRQDALGDVFRAAMPGSVHHTLSLLTQHAAGDAYPVVREEALLAARHLHPDVALRMVAEMLGRESDAAVVLAALDSLEQLAPRMDPAALRPVLAPLATSTDAAVRRRIQALIEEPRG